MSQPVSVTYGVHTSLVDAAGGSVAALKDRVGQIFNLPPDVQTVIDGKPVANDHIIADDKPIEFIKAAGVKGMPEYDDEALARRKAWLREHWQLLVLIGGVALLALVR